MSSLPSYLSLFVFKAVGGEGWTLHLLSLSLSLPLFSARPASRGRHGSGLWDGFSIAWLSRRGHGTFVLDFDIHCAGKM